MGEKSSCQILKYQCLLSAKFKRAKGFVSLGFLNPEARDEVVRVKYSNDPAQVNNPTESSMDVKAEGECMIINSFSWNICC